MKKIRIGIMGAARGSSYIHSSHNIQEAELVAVCDFYKPALDRCRDMAEKFGLHDVAYYMDFEEFLQHDMDAVILANYAHQHAPYAIRVLDSGKHVMSECLTCATMKEAVELIEAVERSGKIYAYAENYCFTEKRLEMRERYRRGDIGDLMYAECEYVHDCSVDSANYWHLLTYGQRDHWRNQAYSTFYCTHSMGPVLYITGLRPVKVSGFETPNKPYMRNLGSAAGIGAVEMVTLENGALLKSLHGGLKRHVYNPFHIAGDKGFMCEKENGELHVYIETEPCKWGEAEEYYPEVRNKFSLDAGHGGGDFYELHFFFRAILGDKEALAQCIDVYMAVDMCIPGILAYRSICNGNISIDIPNLRDPKERDAYRNDTFCSFPDIAGDMWVPNNIHDTTPIPDSVYDEVRKLWEDWLAENGSKR